MTRLFGTSGIRGVVGEVLTPDFCREVGLALGTTLSVGARVCIATDTRLSREAVRDQVASGLVKAGIQVTCLGILPTPALAFITREMGFDAGLMITASHNPPEYNGIKVFNRDAIGYDLSQENAVEAIYHSRDFRLDCPEGNLSGNERAREIYIERLKMEFSRDDFNQSLKVVVDPGNGAASGFVTPLFSDLGIGVMPFNDIPDGNFPGRPSEPTGETLAGTIDFLRQKEADLAVCFDGDADRVVFCDREGFLGFTEMVTYLARLEVERSGKKKVAATIEVGKLMDLALAEVNAEVVRGKIGDVYLAHLVRDQGAAIGVEDIGVYIMPKMGFYPESIFSALNLLKEIESPIQIRKFLRRFPVFHTRKLKMNCPEGTKEPVMNRIEETASYLDPLSINSLDGVRLDFPESWMLIRASGTEPVIRVMAESVNEKEAHSLLEAGARIVEEALSYSR